MKPDLLYLLSLLKGTLYRFWMEQFGDIHCNPQAISITTKKFKSQLEKGSTPGV
jgi:hypothetical protein